MTSVEPESVRERRDDVRAEQDSRGKTLASRIARFRSSPALPRAEREKSLGGGALPKQFWWQKEKNYTGGEDERSASLLEDTSVAPQANDKEKDQASQRGVTSNFGYIPNRTSDVSTRQNSVSTMIHKDVGLQSNHLINSRIGRPYSPALYSENESNVSTVTLTTEDDTKDNIEGESKIDANVSVSDSPLRTHTLGLVDNNKDNSGAHTARLVSASATISFADHEDVLKNHRPHLLTNSFDTSGKKSILHNPSSSPLAASSHRTPTRRNVSVSRSLARAKIALKKQRESGTKHPRFNKQLSKESRKSFERPIASYPPFIDNTMVKKPPLESEKDKRSTASSKLGVDGHGSVSYESSTSQTELKKGKDAQLPRHGQFTESVDEIDDVDSDAETLAAAFTRKSMSRSALPSQAAIAKLAVVHPKLHAALISLQKNEERKKDQKNKKRRQMSDSQFHLSPSSTRVNKKHQHSEMHNKTFVRPKEDRQEIKRSLSFEPYKLEEHIAEMENGSATREAILDAPTPFKFKAIDRQEQSDMLLPSTSFSEDCITLEIVEPSQDTIAKDALAGQVFQSNDEELKSSCHEEEPFRDGDLVSTTLCSVDANDDKTKVYSDMSSSTKHDEQEQEMADTHTEKVHDNHSNELLKTSSVLEESEMTQATAITYQEIMITTDEVTSGKVSEMDANESIQTNPILQLQIDEDEDTICNSTYHTPMTIHDECVVNSKSSIEEDDAPWNKFTESSPTNEHESVSINICVNDENGSVNVILCVDNNLNRNTFLESESCLSNEVCESNIGKQISESLPGAVENDAVENDCTFELDSASESESESTALQSFKAEKDSELEAIDQTSNNDTDDPQEISGKYESRSISDIDIVDLDSEVEQVILEEADSHNELYVENHIETSNSEVLVGAKGRRKSSILLEDGSIRTQIFGDEHVTTESSHALKQSQDCEEAEQCEDLKETDEDMSRDSEKEDDDICSPISKETEPSERLQDSEDEISKRILSSSMPSASLQADMEPEKIEQPEDCPAVVQEFSESAPEETSVPFALYQSMMNVKNVSARLQEDLSETIKSSKENLSKKLSESIEGISQDMFFKLKGVSNEITNMQSLVQSEREYLDNLIIEREKVEALSSKSLEMVKSNYQRIESALGESSRIGETISETTCAKAIMQQTLAELVNNAKIARLESNEIINAIDKVKYDKIGEHFSAAAMQPVINEGSRSAEITVDKAAVQMLACEVMSVIRDEFRRFQAINSSNQATHTNNIAISTEANQFDFQRNCEVMPQNPDPPQPETDAEMEHSKRTCKNPYIHSDSKNLEAVANVASAISIDLDNAIDRVKLAVRKERKSSRVIKSSLSNMSDPSCSYSQRSRSQEMPETVRAQACSKSVKQEETFVEPWPHAKSSGKLYAIWDGKELRLRPKFEDSATTYVQGQTTTTSLAIMELKKQYDETVTQMRRFQTTLMGIRNHI